MAQDQESADAGQAVTLFRRRVLPLIFVAYVLNFLDRTNISYAQLQMSADLGISLAGLYLFKLGHYFLSHGYY